MISSSCFEQSIACRRHRGAASLGFVGMLTIFAVLGCGSSTATVSPATAPTGAPSVATPFATPSAIPPVASPSGVTTPGHGQFVLTASMTVARLDPTATLLADSNVLIIGGCSCGTAELYEPATGKFVLTGSMTVVRVDGMTATRLQDGRVLITGGEDTSQTPLASAELYDPKTGTFSPTGSMIAARWGQTATLLADGKVLVAGGSGTSGADDTTAELYDPKAGTFSATGSMTTTRDGDTATLLADGRVLVVGGAAICALGKPLATAELYDPKTGTFRPTGSMVTARLAQSAVPLSDGRVLVLGGNASCIQEEPLASAEVYDPRTNHFNSIGSMTVARDAQSAIRLGDGRVLVVGGDDLSAELFDPSTGAFTRTGSTVLALDSASATLLADGRVLLAGGAVDASGAALPSAELYQP